MSFKATAGASCAVAFSCLGPLAIPAFAQQPNPVQLDTITVEGPRDGMVATTAGPVQGIRAMTAGSTTRTDTPVERLPQSIQILPRQLLDQQATTTVSEAVTNVSNVQPASPVGIANTEIAPLRIRGFPAEQWRDGLVTLYNAGDRDGLVNAERIEVLKGPSTILYGGGVGSPLGGVVNIVSKLPRNETFAQTGLRIGSHRYWNPWFDINTKLTPDGSALFRVTGEFTGNRSYIDTLDSKRYSINPTLTLTNNDSTTPTIQGFLSRQQQQAYQCLPVYGTILGDFRLRPDTFIGPRNLPDSYTRTHGITTTLDHRFNDVWSAQLKARWSQTQFDQLSQNIFGADATGAVPAFGPSTWFLQNLQLFQKQEEFTINPTVKVEFDLGSTKNVFEPPLDSWTPSSLNFEARRPRWAKRTSPRTSSATPSFRSPSGAIRLRRWRRGWGSASTRSTSGGNGTASLPPWPAMTIRLPRSAG